MDDMFIVKQALSALEQAGLALEAEDADLAGQWMLLSDKWLHVYEHVGLPEDDDVNEAPVTAVSDDEDDDEDLDDEDYDEDEDDEDEDDEDEDEDEGDFVLTPASLNGSHEVGVLDPVDNDPDDIARLGP